MRTDAPTSGRAAERTRLALDGPPPTAWRRFCPHDVLGAAPFPAIEAYLDDPDTAALLEEHEAAERYLRPVRERLTALGVGELFAGPAGADGADVYGMAALNVVTAARNGSLAITLGVNALALLPVYVGGSPAQRAEVFARVRAGAFSSLLLTELDHGSNLLRNAARAEPGRLEADGRFAPLAPGEEEAAATAYRLRGEKDMINGGREHELLFALLRTREPAPGRPSPFAARSEHGFFWLPRQEGVVGLPRWRTLPAQAADISGVRFDGVVVPAAQRLGADGEGFLLAKRTLLISRGGIAALAAGLLAQARGRALRYARRRDVYGAPILELDAIADHLVRMDALERAVAAASLRAVAFANAWGAGAAHYTGVAKVMGCALAEEGVDEGRRLVGGRALVRELPYERIVRDVLLYGVFDGTSHVMLDELQARLGQEVRRWTRDPTGGGRDTLAEVVAVLGRPPRPLVEAIAEHPREPKPLPLVPHTRALAGLPGEVDVAPLADLAEALFAAVAALRAGETWSDDQGERFGAAEVHARLEVLCGLVELFDLDRRAALGLTPPRDAGPLDRAGFAHAFGWLGAQAADRLERLTLGADLPPDWLPEHLTAAGGLPAVRARLLKGHAARRRAVRAALRA